MQIVRIGSESVHLVPLEEPAPAPVKAALDKQAPVAVHERERKGQMTIPIEIRRRLGFGPGSRVGFVIRRAEVVLEKVSGNATRRREIVRRLRGKGTVPMTTDQILALTRKA